MPEGVEPIPIVTPQEALRYFRAKGLEIGFSWLDVWQEEHARAFTVAKAMSRDLLEDIRAAVDAAIAEGKTLAEFTAGLRPTLEARGWWGRKAMIDPLTAERRIVQLGSPRRLRTIYRVNMRTAYQAGRWERIERQKAVFPFLRYTSVMDGRERPEHHAWHDTVLPIGDAWWDTHYPPCGWNCRCTAVAMTARQLARRGLAVTEQPVIFKSRPWTNKRTGEVHAIEQGIDPGWSYNVGKASLAGLAPPPIGSGFGGADIAAAAAPIASFLDTIGVGEDEVAGQVFIDRAGWPLAISAAWFRDAGGRPQLPEPARRAQLPIAAATIATPDEIRWVWVRGENGRALLFRRYLSLDGERVACAVDVGEGWRFRVAKHHELGALRAGTIAWSAEQPATAAYDPRQARDRRGRWSRTAGFAAVVMGGSGVEHTELDIGVAGKESPEHVRGFARRLSSSAVRHAIGHHASDARPLQAGDLALVADTIRSGVKQTHGSVRAGRGQSISHALAIDGGTLVYVETVGVKRRRLTMKTAYWKE